MCRARCPQVDKRIIRNNNTLPSPVISVSRRHGGERRLNAGPDGPAGPSGDDGNGFSARYSSSLPRQGQVSSPTVHGCCTPPVNQAAFRSGIHRRDGGSLAANLRYADDAGRGHLPGPKRGGQVGTEVRYVRNLECKNFAPLFHSSVEFRFYFLFNQTCCSLCKNCSMRFFALADCRGIC